MQWSSWHNHTGDECRFSYCAEAELTPAAYRRALRAGPWRAFAITEHAFALAIPADEPCWPHQWYHHPERLWQHRAFREDKTAQYLTRMAKVCDGTRLFCGLEVEVDADGALSMDDALWPYLDVVIGSIHYLPGQPPAWIDAYFAQLDALLYHPIDILGHPFRMLAGTGPVPDEVIDETLARAQAAGVAVEINAHMPYADDAHVLRRAAASDACVAFGLDAHQRRQLHQHTYFERVLADSSVNPDTLRLFQPVRKMSKPRVPVR